MASIGRTTSPLLLSHYNVQPVFDVSANVQGTDLGSVSARISQIISKYRSKMSKASSIVVRGQVQSMNQAFFQMGLGVQNALVSSGEQPAACPGPPNPYGPLGVIFCPKT